MWQLRAASNKWPSLPKNGLQTDLTPQKAAWVQCRAWHWCWNLLQWEMPEQGGVFREFVWGGCWTLTPYPAKICWCSSSVPWHVTAVSTKDSSACSRAAGIYSGEDGLRRDGMLPEMHRRLRPALTVTPPHAGTLILRSRKVEIQTRHSPEIQESLN